MAEPYRPISCIDHETLEFAALRRLPLWIAYVDAAGVRRRERVCPRDVYTRAGAEWLEAEGGSGLLALRLDRIEAIASSDSDD